VNTLAGWRKRLTDFLFPDESDEWLTLLRLGLGLQTVLYALSLLNDWNYLFGTAGSALITRDLAEALLALENSLVPRLGWLVAIGSHVGWQEQTVLWAVWICLLCSGLTLVLGLFSRFSAVLAWFLHLCAARSGAFVSYGVDDFMTIGLFYLMLSPLPDRYSVDCRLRKSQPRNEWLGGFFRRVLQLHLCLIYFFSGLTKCLGSGWWDGSNLWRALTHPPFNVVPPEILIRWKWFFPILGIAICLIETGYPIFIWLKKTRFIWLMAVLTMHIAIGVTMGMYLFSLVMIVLNLAAYAPGSWVSAQGGKPVANIAFITR
jgi:hypothetical protein